jgi:glycosyltransferase involved in cell wall biosynthesis
MFDSIVVISPYPWIFGDGMWQTTHNVAKQFAHICPTLYVEPAPQWSPRAEWHRSEGLLRGMFGVRTSQPAPNLTVFHRRGFPCGRFDLVRNFDLAANARSLSRWLKEHGFIRPLLWHSFPYWSEPLVDAVAPRLFAYHCLDFSLRAEEETRLVRRADAVFCVSTTLTEKFKPLNRNTYWMPNGVDLQFYDAERGKTRPRPEQLPANGRLIGFVGSLNYHLDLELLVQVAKSFPNDYLIIAGKTLGSTTVPQREQLEALQHLKTLKNVRMLGFVPTADIAAYLNAFDVCLIPFIQNEFNQECDPLKLYQYMAMGRPVVTTPVAVTRNFPDLVYIAHHHAEFIERIRQALNHPDDETSRQKRMDFARAHSWPAIVAKALHAIEEIASVKTAPTSEVGL